SCRSAPSQGRSGTCISPTPPTWRRRCSNTPASSLSRSRSPPPHRPERAADSAVREPRFTPRPHGPGSRGNLYWEWPRPRAALGIDRLPLSEDRDDLVPYAICEAVMGVKFYGAILDALRDVGGYSLGDINNPHPGDSLFIYNYDWRRDNVESAIGLGRAIRKIKTRLKAPELRFDIVAHSMGGMLAECYLKYGTVDALDGASE